MDNFCEQLVVKIRTSADNAKALFIIGGIGLAAAAAVFFAFYVPSALTTVLLVAAAGLMVLGYHLLRGMGVEYEYIVTNNELDIDKIVGRRKRTRLVTIDLREAEDFYEYPPKEEEFDATVHASSGVEKDAHCLVARHKDYGRVNVIFNPDERMREAIAQEFPIALRARMDKDGK